MHRNSPNIAQIIRIIAILLSGKFQENRIVESDSNYCPKNLISDSDKSRRRARVAQSDYQAERHTPEYHIGIDLIIPCQDVV